MRRTPPSTAAPISSVTTTAVTHFTQVPSSPTACTTAWLTVLAWSMLKEMPAQTSTMTAKTMPPTRLFSAFS